MVGQTAIEVAISLPAEETSEDEPKVTTFITSWDQAHVPGPEDLAPRTRAGYTPVVTEVGLLATYQRLAQLSQLEQDWDSYGAISICEGAITAAHDFLSLISRELGSTFGERVGPYSVVPLADGGVQIEWRGLRSALELEIEPTGALSSLLVQDHESGRTYEEHDQLSSPGAVNLIARTLRS